MPSSAEWWSIDGESLHQYGWSVATVGGSRYDLPARRGENIRVAYRPGALHRPKLADQRVVQLIMWLTGTDPATGGAVADPTLRWNDSWDFLRRLVWKPDGAQVTLTRRWRLTVDGAPTLVEASALAEIADSMAPAMTGRTRSDFTMTLLLADPYYYGGQVTTPIPLDTPTSVVNRGHDIAAHNGVQVDLIGPLTNPRLTNSTPNPDVWVQLDTVPAGQTVTLDVGAFTATRSDGANVINDIVHSGSRWWMGLLSGANTLTLTADSGTGSAVLRHQPPYV